MPRFLGAIGGNEAKGVVYASMPADELVTAATLNRNIRNLQAGVLGHKPNKLTYPKYTFGFADAGLGEIFTDETAPNGFISNADPAAIAFAGELGQYSLLRPWRSLYEMIGSNRDDAPGIKALEVLVENLEGMSVAELNQLVLGESKRYTTGKNAYYRQLGRQGLVHIEELDRKKDIHGLRTRVFLDEDVIDDCMQLLDIVKRFANPSPADIKAGEAKSKAILSDPKLVRELIRKSFDTSPWA